MKLLFSSSASGLNSTESWTASGHACSSARTGGCTRTLPAPHSHSSMLMPPDSRLVSDAGEMPADPEGSVRRQANVCIYIQTGGFAYRQNPEHTSGLRPPFNYQTYRWEIKTLTCRAGNGGDARGAHADQHGCTQQMTGGGAHGIQKRHTEERNRASGFLSQFWR